MGNCSPFFMNSGWEQMAAAVSAAINTLDVGRDHYQINYTQDGFKRRSTCTKPLPLLEKSLK